MAQPSLDHYLAQEYDVIRYVHTYGPPNGLPDISANERVIYHQQSCQRVEQRTHPCTCTPHAWIYGSQKGYLGIRRYTRPQEKAPRPRMSPEERAEAYSRAWQTRKRNTAARAAHAAQEATE